MEFRTAYSQPLRVTADPVGETLTEQSHKQNCDSTKIVRRYLKTGVVDHLNTRTPIDGMTEPGIDYKTALDVVARGKSAFESQPAELRRQFDYNPQLFVDFCLNPENSDKLVEMGLANAPKQALQPEIAIEEAPPTE